jgi:peptide/nickel transport system permease protein
MTARSYNIKFRIGVVLLGLIAAMAIGAALKTPHDPLLIDIAARLQPPSSGHLLGTDDFGRDALSRLMKGALSSLATALVTTFFSMAFGVMLGVLAGFGRGWPDRLLMIGNDALLAFPGILLALGLIAIVGPGQTGVIIALTIAFIPGIVRIVRSTAMSISMRDFVTASRLMGNSGLYTMYRHVLPNCGAPITVLATSVLGWTLLSESALSFLGLGLAPPAPTWGNMLAASRPYFLSSPLLSLAPGLCIVITLLGTNLIGDGLRDRSNLKMTPS